MQRAAAVRAPVVQGVQLPAATHEQNLDALDVDRHRGVLLEVLLVGDGRPLLGDPIERGPIDPYAAAIDEVPAQVCCAGGDASPEQSQHDSKSARPGLAREPRGPVDGRRGHVADCVRYADPPVFTVGAGPIGQTARCRRKSAEAAARWGPAGSLPPAARW